MFVLTNNKLNLFIMETHLLTPLERKVYGNNLINSLSKDAVKFLLPQLQKYVGKKVCTVDNTKTKSFVYELLTIPYIAESGQSYRTYLHFDRDSLILFNDVTVKDTEYSSGGYGASYYKKEIYIGKVENQILTELFDFEKICAYNGLNNHYDVKDQQERKCRIEKLETEIRLLKYDLL